MSDRFLVALGYHGNSFHGSQIQPDVGTVEGSMRDALRRLTWWSEGCLEMSSRTDAGVSELDGMLDRVRMERTGTTQQPAPLAKGGMLPR